MTIKELVEELRKYPEDSLVVAYEGEKAGLRIDSPATKEVLNSKGAPWFLHHPQVGFIEIIEEHLT